MTGGCGDGLSLPVQRFRPNGLDDPTWRQRPARRLVDVHTGRRPTWPTDVRLVATTEQLAIHFDCRAGTVRATMTDYKDKVWQEDAVEVYLRPWGDTYLYELQLSPIGTCRDLRVVRSDHDDRSYDDSWSCRDMVTAAIVDRDAAGAVAGWRAVFTIPWRSVGERLPAVDRPWSVALFRIERDPFEYSGLRAVTRPDLDLHDPRLQLPLTVTERP